MARWIAHLRRRDRARHRARQRPGAGARSHREGRSGSTGRRRSAAACCRPARCARSRMGRCRSCPAIAEGAWWVQDAAAALPARLARRRARPDRRRSLRRARRQDRAACRRRRARHRGRPLARQRLERLRQNLARLQLAAETVAADAAEWQGGPFDAVLLDAPCSSTGTIRRHPDIPWLKREADIAALAALQRRLLDHAVDADRSPAARWSIAPARSNRRRASDVGRGAARARSARCAGSRSRPARSAGLGELLTPTATCARCPAIWPDPEPRMGGLDGFYAARLRTDLNGDSAAVGRRRAPSLSCRRGQAGRCARESKGGERVDVARFDRGADQAVRVPGARRGLRRLVGRAARPSADRAGRSSAARPTGC